MDEIKAAYPDIRSLVGKTIYVKASVLTQTGRESSVATRVGCVSYDSLFTSHTTIKTSHFLLITGEPIDGLICQDRSPGNHVTFCPVDTSCFIWEKQTYEIQLMRFRENQSS